MNHDEPDWWGDDPDLGLDLEAERDAPPPDAAARERVMAGVLSRVGGGPSGPGGAGEGAPVSAEGSPDIGAGSASSTAAGSSVAPWVGGLLVAAVVGALWWGASTPETTSDVPATETPETPAPASIATHAAAEPRDAAVAPLAVEMARTADQGPAPRTEAPIPRLPASARAPHAPRETPAERTGSERAAAEGTAPHAAAMRPSRADPSAEDRPPPKRPSTLAREQALLSEGRAALRRGEAAGAYRAIERHAAQFPRGQLVEAREVLRIQALVREGRQDGARRAVARFRARFPDSLLGPALEDALATPSEETPP